MATAIKAALAEESPQRGAVQRVASEIGTSVNILSNLANGRTDAKSHPGVAYPDTPAEGDCLGYLVGVVRRWGSKEITVYDPNGIQPD